MQEELKKKKNVHESLTARKRTQAAEARFSPETLGTWWRDGQHACASLTFVSSFVGIALTADTKLLIYLCRWYETILYVSKLLLHPIVSHVAVMVRVTWLLGGHGHVSDTGWSVCQAGGVCRTAGRRSGSAVTCVCMCVCVSGRRRVPDCWPAGWVSCDLCLYVCLCVGRRRVPDCWPEVWASCDLCLCVCLCVRQAAGAGLLAGGLGQLWPVSVCVSVCQAGGGCRPAGRRAGSAVTCVCVCLCVGRRRVPDCWPEVWASCDLCLCVCLCVRQVAGTGMLAGGLGQLWPVSVCVSVCRQAAGAGLLAGGLGQLLSSPADLVKVQMQMEGRRRLLGHKPRWDAAQTTGHQLKDTSRGTKTYRHRQSDAKLEASTSRDAKLET